MTKTMYAHRTLLLRRACHGLYLIPLLISTLACQSYQRNTLSLKAVNTDDYQPGIQSTVNVLGYSGSRNSGWSCTGTIIDRVDQNTVTILTSPLCVSNKSESVGLPEEGLKVERWCSHYISVYMSDVNMEALSTPLKCVDGSIRVGRDTPVAMLRAQGTIPDHIKPVTLSTLNLNKTNTRGVRSAYMMSFFNESSDQSPKPRMRLTAQCYAISPRDSKAMRSVLALPTPLSNLIINAYFHNCYTSNHIGGPGSPIFDTATHELLGITFDSRSWSERYDPQIATAKPIIPSFTIKSESYLYGLDTPNCYVIGDGRICY